MANSRLNSFSNQQVTVPTGHAETKSTIFAQQAASNTSEPAPMVTFGSLGKQNPTQSLSSLTNKSNASHPVPLKSKDTLVTKKVRRAEAAAKQAAHMEAKRNSRKIKTGTRRSARLAAQVARIKMPTFKSVVKKGFPALAKIGYGTFASKMTYENRDILNIKEIEDAWKSALWSELQKWNVKDMTREQKMTQYHNAVDQIHNQNKSLLRELAGEEGRAPKVNGFVVKFKVPQFKKSLREGFLGIPLQLGFPAFAQRVFESNNREIQSRITLKQVEDAWKAFLWSEFQKWNAGDMTPETKMTHYNNAVNQIYDCHEAPLLGELAKREGKLPQADKKVVEGREDSVDMEEFMREEFNTGEVETDDEDVAVTPDNVITAPPSSGNSLSRLSQSSRRAHSIQNVLRTGSLLPGYFDPKKRGETLPFIKPEVKLQYSSDWYWDADGTCIDGPRVSDGNNGEVVQQCAEFKVVMTDGSAWIDEDLYEDNSDDGAKVGKGSDGKNTAFIDLTGDDTDTEEAVSLTAQATVKEDTEASTGDH